MKYVIYLTFLTEPAAIILVVPKVPAIRAILRLRGRLLV